MFRPKYILFENTSFVTKYLGILYFKKLDCQSDFTVLGQDGSAQRFLLYIGYFISIRRNTFEGVSLPLTGWTRTDLFLHRTFYPMEYVRRSITAFNRMDPYRSFFTSDILPDGFSARYYTVYQCFMNWYFFCAYENVYI